MFFRSIPIVIFPRIGTSTSRIMDRVTKELKDFGHGLSLTGGDLGSLSQLFFDNLSTLLGAIFALQGLQGAGVSQSVMDEYVWGKIVPGVGVTLLLGNIYYSWQAVRLTNTHGRQYTAQPYGLVRLTTFYLRSNILIFLSFDRTLLRRLLLCSISSSRYSLRTASLTKPLLRATRSPWRLTLLRASFPCFSVYLAA